jgi:hypothetical protein
VGYFLESPIKEESKYKKEGLYISLSWELKFHMVAATSVISADGKDEREPTFWPRPPANSWFECSFFFKNIKCTVFFSICCYRHRFSHEPWDWSFWTEANLFLRCKNGLDKNVSPIAARGEEICNDDLHNTYSSLNVDRITNEGRWGNGVCSTHGEIRNSYYNLIGTEEKRPLARPGHKREDNTKVYPKFSGLAAWSENCKR